MNRISFWGYGASIAGVKNNVLFTHPSDSSNTIRCSGQSQCVQRDETCFSFLSQYPPTHSPQPILYPIPPGVPLHCCFIGGWLLSTAGSRHFPRQHNYKVRFGSVQFFSFLLTPKTSGPTVSRHCSYPFEIVLSRLRVSPPTVIIIYCTFRICAVYTHVNCSDEIPVYINKLRANNWPTFIFMTIVLYVFDTYAWYNNDMYL